MKTYKKRPIYIDRIRPFMDKNIVKVIVGQRRVGKSYLFWHIMDELRMNYNVKDDQIIYINKELNEFENMSDHNDLLEYIKKYNTKSKKYIFIDEIQDINNFEKAIRDLQAIENYDIYITGSNAHLLSSDIATYLTGRYVQFEIYPLNYVEFLDFHNLSSSKDNFLKYIRFGGLPYLIHIELQEEVIRDYIKSIYNTILLKDIVKRYNIRNIDFLEKLVYCLANNIGQLTTAKNIVDYLKSQKINISVNVTLDYMSFLSSVFMINKARRQEIVGKKIFEINDKFYFSDLGIRNTILGGYNETDISKILENIIFLHFKSLGYDIYIGKNKSKEIDFIVQKGNDIKYIQVCYIISDENVRQREFGNLLEIKDNYEKIVLSMDDIVSDYKGVRHYNIIEYISR